MILRWFGGLVVFCGMCLPGHLGSEIADRHGLRGAIEIYRQLAPRPDARVPRIWTGAETICVIAQLNNETLVRDFAAALNTGYQTEFDVVRVREHVDCPDTTSVFVLSQANASEQKLADVLEGIHGTRPGHDFFRQDITGGFSVTLPEPQAREFVYFDAQPTPVHGNPFPSRSIMLEEMLHSLTGLGDFTSNRIVSLLGENADVYNYAHWYTKNPVGLCDADLYLLEMTIGANV